MNLFRRLPPGSILVIGLLAATASIIGAFSPWWAVAGGVLTAVIVTMQYRTNGPTVIRFSKEDWKGESDELHFSAGARHGKGRHPVASVYMPLAGGGYEEIICDVHTLESGETILKASKRFDGEVRIS